MTKDISLISEVAYLELKLDLLPLLLFRFAWFAPENFLKTLES